MSATAPVLHPFNVDVLSYAPYVAVIPNFLNDAECEHLKMLARPGLAPSTVVSEDGSQSIRSQARTSSGMFFRRGQDAVVADIEDRIAAWTRLPVKNGESFQVLHYQVGEEYKPHPDYFDTRFAGRAEFLKRGGQRVATVLLYLVDVEAGGETLFTQTGLKVPARKGWATLFYNVTPDGDIDPMSWHASLPVLAGEKWTVTKWIRENEFI